MLTTGINPTASLNGFVEVVAAVASAGSGPLAGVAIAIKDMVDMAGRAPGMGLGLAKPVRGVPNKNAAVLDILLKNGAHITGFTQMTPLAFEPSGANTVCGRPLNPWNAELICGGSSSGSAVAVASGAVPLAIGSDTAGSLRIPAHCCGITAWKPTYGLIPLDGVMPLAPSLDTIGFLSRDANLLAEVAGLFANSGRDIGRIGIARDLTAICAPEIQAAMAGLEATLGETGMTLAPVELAVLLAACDVPLLTILSGEAARANADLIAGGVLDSALHSRLEKGFAITDEQLAGARTALGALAASQAAQLFETCDAVLLPVMASTTPRVADCEPGSTTFSGRTLYGLSRFTRFVNALGLPAIGFPAGAYSSNMPIGLQLVGPRGSDIPLIKAVMRIQQASRWHIIMPSLPQEPPKEPEA